MVIVADTNVWARALPGDDVKESPRARTALADARTRGGFADHLIAHVAFANGCREAITFDGLFSKASKMTKLE